MGSSLVRYFSSQLKNQTRPSTDALRRNHQRIRNEVRALKLVSEKTTIPVPRLLNFGTLGDGRQFLVTERIDGVTLINFKARPCANKSNKHTEEATCTTCRDIAYANATDFVNKVALPQLHSLKSRHRGIDGFVMCPAWICEELGPPWPGKVPWKILPLEEPDYIFQHGDLAAQNLLMDRETLQVTALLDWEHAGFFPPGMEKWPGTLSPEAYADTGCNAEIIARCLGEEYIECYEAWENQEQLRKMVENGDLPSLEYVKMLNAKE